jgi:hypothetical protein
MDSDSTPPENGEKTWVVPFAWVHVSPVVCKEHDQFLVGSQLAHFCSGAPPLKKFRTRQTQ